MNVVHTSRTVVATLGALGFFLIASASADDPGRPAPDGQRYLTLRQVPPQKDKEKADANGEKKDWKAWVPPGPPLTLGQCLEIGQSRQPAVAAARASLAASERGYLALHNLKRPVLSEVFSPDLPVRRQQSERGIAAATAEVLKAQQETTYDVTRLYFTYVYATQQEQTANEIVEQMETFYKSAEDFLKLEVPDPKVKINEFTLGTLDSIIAEVKDLRDKASVGRKKAMYALKEAMGVEHEFAFVPSNAELPLMTGEVTLDGVLAQAMCRRPELTQAAVVLEVTRLEVCAQAQMKRSPKADTFASGTDLHARHLPAPVRNGEYRPGAVPPEMPAQLVGRVEDRVARVEEYVRHQEACYVKAAGLVRLEATNAYLTWESAVGRVKDAKERHERQQKLVEKSRAASATKMDPQLLIENEARASQAQARYVQAVYDQILALIALEKVTGGGITPAFPGR